MWQQLLSSLGALVVPSLIDKLVDKLPTLKIGEMHVPQDRAQVETALGALQKRLDQVVHIQAQQTEALKKVLHVVAVRAVVALWLSVGSMVLSAIALGAMLWKR